MLHCKYINIILCPLSIFHERVHLLFPWIKRMEKRATWTQEWTIIWPRQMTATKMTMCSCYIKKLLNKIERFLLSSALIFFHCIRGKVMKGKIVAAAIYVSSLLQIKFFIIVDMREYVFVCLHCKLGVLLHSKGKALSKIHFRLA